jgi:hypothetical protein
MVERDFEARRQIKASLFWYGLAVNPENGKLSRQVIFKPQGKSIQGFFDGKTYPYTLAGWNKAAKEINRLNCGEK